jgi:zinc and cadmium transporter
MDILFSILIATVLVSLISFVGVIALLKKKILDKLLAAVIAFASGALIGSAFLHLIPEASDKLSYSSVSFFVLVGFILFFLIEKILFWRHCHEGNCKVHTFSYIVLVGDAVHNFLDGLIIASSFIISPAIGLASTIAIALHEIPQEIGDFGVLIYGGMKKGRALFLNFLVALTAVLGGILGFLFSESLQISNFIIPIAAGGFIYIAASDLIPELKKETKLKKSLLDFIIFLIGIALMSIL